MKTFRTLSASGIFFVIAFIAAACNSPLNNAIINQPSSIQEVIEFDRTINISGFVEQSILVTLFDKNGAYVQIQNGGVSVSGVNLLLQTNGLGNPYYTAPTDTAPRLWPDSSYKVTITLGDGTTYVTTVRTPHDLTQFTAPAQVSRSADIPISWQTNDAHCTMTVYISDGSVIDPTNGYQVSIANPSSGSYTIPNSFTTGHTAPGGMRLSLRAQLRGTPNSQLISTSLVYTNFYIEKDVSY